MPRLLGVELAIPDHTTLSRAVATWPVASPGPFDGPVHLVLDSTGLQLVGQGEGDATKHGRTRRRWRKLHVAVVDAVIGEIAAHVLTEGNAGNAVQAPALLWQAEGVIASVTADGAYDGERPLPSCGSPPARPTARHGHPAACVRGAEHGRRRQSEPARPPHPVHRREGPHALFSPARCWWSRGARARKPSDDDRADRLNRSAIRRIACVGPMRGRGSRTLADFLGSRVLDKMAGADLLILLWPRLIAERTYRTR
jgi:hypothetical protein